MSKSVEFFFDFGSPTSYLAWTQLPGIAAAADAQIVWRPMLLGGIFKATGNQSPVSIPAKGRYMLQDLARFAKRYGVALHFNPHVPINTLTLMRGATGYLDTPQLQPYLHAVFDAMWVRQKNLGNPEVFAEVLSAAGLDRAAFEALVNDDAVKQRLKDSTDEAIKRGVFGAPTFFVGQQMHFGQDRLDFVAEALAHPA
jgi:2-hydroxychromene-2-carboxylate isomerase